VPGGDPNASPTDRDTYTADRDSSTTDRHAHSINSYTCCPNRDNGSHNLYPRFVESRPDFIHSDPCASNTNSRASDADCRSATANPNARHSYTHPADSFSN
jgi:hypothetical protein